ncbi:MAG TPA: hypothetical protein VI912_05020 [Candidatus Bilamarchaeaceae archaeon]|nr:hypothetical protein [Candidatus Bilamarchaeaceae archaeon]
MKILGLDHEILVYDLATVAGGIGFGIVLANSISINTIWGFVIMIITFFLSVYLWNRKIKKYFFKN